MAKERLAQLRERLAQLLCTAVACTVTMAGVGYVCSGPLLLLRYEGRPLSRDELMEFYRKSEVELERIVGLMRARGGREESFEFDVGSLSVKIGARFWWARGGVVFVCANRFGGMRDMRYQGFAIGQEGAVKRHFSDATRDGSLWSVNEWVWGIE